MKAPWFSRRWIIQEVALSRNATIHCANHVVHWDGFADAVSLLTEKIDTLTSSFREEIFEDLETTSACILVQILTNICRKSDDGKVLATLLDLETLVSTLLGFQATFPRDTIYSILSLARDSPVHDGPWELLHASQLKKNSHNAERAKKKRRGSNASQPDSSSRRAVGLTPNYKFSTRDLFVAFVTRCVHNSEGLDIICRHWAPRVYDRAYGEEVIMPSWISSMSKAPYGIPGVSLGRQNGENFVAYSPRDQRKHYNASGAHKAELRMVDDPALDSDDAVLLGHRAKTNITGAALTWSPLPSPTLEKDSNSLLKSIVGQGNPSFQLSYDINHSDTTGSSEPPILAPTVQSTGESQTPKVNERTTRHGLEAIATAGANPSPSPSHHQTPNLDTAIDTSSQSPTVARKELPPVIPNGSLSSIMPPVTKVVIGVKRPLSSTSDSPSKQEPPLIQVNTLNVPRQSPLPSPLSVYRDHSLTPHGSGVQRLMPARKATKTIKPEDVERQHELGGVISVKGFVLGRITEHSDVIRGGVIPGEWVEKLGWDIEQNHNIVPDTLWRLLVADREPKGSKPPQWYKRACLHGLVDSRVVDADGNIHTVMPADRKISECTTRYFERVRNVVWKRRIVAVEFVKGSRAPLFGLAPKNCSVGDIVCILFGCSVPVILKQVPEYSIPVYQLAGDAYIHGMMDGEAVQDDSLVAGLKRDFILT